jgi:hypothetical protein
MTPSRLRPRTADRRFCWSEAIWWAWEDLNLRPHPYQVSRAQRCADRRFPRSLASVRGQGMRSYSPPGSAHGRAAGAAGKVGQQPLACKMMGLPGGRGSPIEGGVLVTVVRLRAQAEPCGRLVWRRARPARPTVPGQRLAHPATRRASRTGRSARSIAPGCRSGGARSGAQRIADTLNGQ